MYEPEIRLAEPDDLIQLADLEAQARNRLIDQRGGNRWLEEHPPARWVDLVSMSTVTVACLDGVVLGYLVCLSRSGGIAAIEQVYVTPEARGIGCGDGMMAFTIERARASGHRLLEGEALPGDRETKNLFERAGITARLITVSVAL
jgi:GNAT superfamily N-acetyltransferase